jgi:hypothetical protein
MAGAVLAFAVAGFVLAWVLGRGMDINHSGLKDRSVAFSAATVCGLLGFVLTLVMSAS